MHEMGIAMQLAEIAKSAIPPEMKGAPVEKVRIKIGKLSSVVPDSLRFCYDIIIKETALDGSVLEIEEIAVKARCRECSAEWTVDEPAFQCTQCKSTSIDIISGQELEVESIEVADQQNNEQE